MHDPYYQVAHTAGFILWRNEERAWWSPRGWKLTIYPLLDFKRWAFSRCAGCGQRFPWGYSPVSIHWEGGGPRWFRSERGVYHHHCSGRLEECST